MKMFYTLEETAQKLGVSTDEVLAMVARGELESMSSGQTRMFTAKAVNARLADQLRSNMSASAAPGKEPGTPVRVFRLPPPPRKVRGGMGGVSIWLARLFITPHTFIGLGAIFYLILFVLWSLLGTTVPGTITDAVLTPQQKNSNAIRYTLGYSYVVEGVTRQGTQNIDEPTYARFKNIEQLSAEDRKVAVKHFAIGDLRRAALPAYESEAGAFAVLVFIAAFWNGIMFIFIYMLWIKPLRLFALYKFGLATTGWIVSKRSAQGRSTSHYVTYTFKDPFTGQDYKSETQVVAINWLDLEEGDEVTVLYSPTNPKRSTVYGMSGLEVDLDEAGMTHGDFSRR